MKKWLACSLLIAMSGCPDVKTDPGEGPGAIANAPTVEFDPGNAIIPFPNNLVLDPTTGKVNAPATACEGPAAKAVREGVLNQLDGFGTYEAGMQVTFTSDVDMTTVTPDTVKMFERAKDGMALATPKPIDVFIQPSTALRFDAKDCTAAPKSVNAITIIPTVPLDEHATYTVALLSGIKTTNGADYGPSFTWALVRQPTDPVKLADGCDHSQPDTCTIISEQTPLTPGGDANGNGVPDQTEIVGLDQLWKAEAQALALIDPIVGNDRSKVLVAWEVNTQTTTDPLDPMVSGSPASKLGNTPLLGMQSIVCNKDATTCPNGYDHAAEPYAECNGGESGAVCFLEIALGSSVCGAGCTPAQIYQTGKGVCGQVGCAAVGDIMAAGLSADEFQMPLPNPLSGGAAIPGQWSDPVHPTAQGGGILQVLVFVPADNQVPANGYPTVIFGHGLTRSKNDLFAIGPQLAANHYAAVAIDFVASGSRAVQTSNDAALGCSGTPNPSAAPQCFSPILSTNLGQTRDNIRQTVLDLERLTNAIAACGPTNCTSSNSTGNLHVDATKIEYIGQSLGGIIGTIFTAVEPKVKASVLNVAAGGLLDTLEHTDSLGIRCQLVNGLIDAGILQGDKWNPQANTGLCTTDAWKMNPAYQQFSGIARIVLDPADPANFLGLLSQRRFLEQEVIGDQVVPNFATEHAYVYAGVMPVDADPATSATPAPSAALTAMPMANHWLQYKPVPASGQFPGNTFAHGSLLAPAAGAAGQLGTARMQTDAIYFLSANQ